MCYDFLRWQDAGATEHGLALLRCTHETSWFVVDGLHGLCKFVQGTMAGSAIADIVFIMAIAIVIRRLEANFAAADLVTYNDTMAAGEFFGLATEDIPLRIRIVNPVFVDDYAVPVFTSADNFFRKAIAVMTCMWNVFWKFHSILNMAPGKTALLPMVHGPKS